MKHLLARVGLGLVLVLFLLLSAGVPFATAQPALDETWIAFTSLAPGEEGIWVVHPDGSGLSRLTEGRDLYPTWSPDGTLLAYVHEVSGTLLYGQISGYNSEIRIVDTAGQIRYTVGQNDWVVGEAATPLTGTVGLPQWSSDGRAISYGVDLQYLMLVAWGGRRTFYLFPPRIETGYGPQGRLLAGGTLMLDQSWGPGPVPTWVQTNDNNTDGQLMAYNQMLLDAPGEMLLSPSWSPDGQSMTIYRQMVNPEEFCNALLQVNAAGEVERTLFESDDLYLYTIAEPSPDGQQHLIGVSADASGWFGQALASKLERLGPASVLPLDPPPTGYLYVLGPADARKVVAQPQPGTVDLVSRQAWSPDGSQVVFMRAPHPAAETIVESGLGIYVGPPGQTERIVPFSPNQLILEWTVAYPVWQPMPGGPLPTMVPLELIDQEATAAATAEPTMPQPTETPPPPSRTAAASSTSTSTPTPTATATPPPVAPATAQPDLRIYILIAIGVVVLVLVGLILWMILGPGRRGGGARTLRAPAFLTRLFKRRQPGGEKDRRSPFRPLLRRSKPGAKKEAQPGGGLLRRPKVQPTLEEAEPKRRFALFPRRSQPTPPAPAEPEAEPPSIPTAALGDKVAAETAFPSLRTRQEGPVEWPESEIPDLTAAEPPAEWAAADERPAAGPEAPAEWLAAEDWSAPVVPGEPAIGVPSSRAEPQPAPPVPTAETIPVSPAELPPRARELLQQGVAQVQAGKLAAGMLTLHKAIQAAPRMGAAWLWLGWAAAMQDQRVLAERCFGRAQELGMGEEAERALAWLREK